MNSATLLLAGAIICLIVAVAAYAISSVTLILGARARRPTNPASRPCQRQRRARRPGTVQPQETHRR